MSRPKGKRGQDQNVGSIEQFTSVSGRSPPRWVEKKRRFLTSCLENGGESWMGKLGRDLLVVLPGTTASLGTNADM